jgi:hypothetical protein
MLHHFSNYKIASKNWQKNLHVAHLTPMAVTTDNTTDIRKMNIFKRDAWDEYHR